MSNFKSHHNKDPHSLPRKELTKKVIPKPGYTKEFFKCFRTTETKNLREYSMEEN